MSGAPLPHPDARLIRVCHRFAEDEFAAWYRYCTAPGDTADEQDVPPDLDTLHWLEATPATTPEGWQAKALACAAWHRGVYDAVDDGRGVGSLLLATLLREMVGPTRNAIVARLATQYGPLPAEYTAEGVWLKDRPPVQDAGGKWPRNLFPPGQHPTDCHGPSIPDEPDDSELIAACAGFDALERAYVATYATDIPESTPEWTAAEAERDRLLAAEKPFLARMTELRAITLEGQTARARSLILWAPDLVGDGTGDTIGCLTHAVLRDLIGEARS